MSDPSTTNNPLMTIFTKLQSVENGLEALRKQLCVSTVYTKSMWVVRDSDCGNGNDDPGHVISIHPSQAEAEYFLHLMRTDPGFATIPWRGTLSIEGPIMVRRFPHSI